MILAFGMALGLASATPQAAMGAHAACPMAEHRRAVDQRHQDATGVAGGASEHHFRLTPDGGSILLEAADAHDDATRDAARAHLQHIARAFAAGDFSLPYRIHDRVPPGVPELKRLRAGIRYGYEDTERGGRVTLTTSDPEALRAVHEFLRFQIRDHATGDPESE